MARWYRRRYRLRRLSLRLKIPRYILLLFIVITLFCLFRVVERNLSPAIMTMAEARAHIVATETIHRILYDKVLSNVSYNDLIYVHKDTEQRITMMQANTIKISRIVSQAHLEIKESLRTLDDEILYVPLGYALGSKVLSNYGPRIKVRIIPVGTVDVKFVDEFQQAGINQVRHILYLNIQTAVNIIIPTAQKGVTVVNQLPIAETIIVGEVPGTYVDLDSGIIKAVD